MRAMLRHRCTRERAVVTETDGYEEKVWRPHKQRERCLLQEKRAVLRKEEHGEDLEVDGVIYFARTSDVKPRSAEEQQDRVTITKPESPGGTFLIVFVADQAGFAYRQGLLKAYVKRVRPKDPPPP